MNYQRHSNAFKEAILQKLSQSELSRQQFAEQEGIKLSTLYSWQKQFNTSGFSESKVSSSNKWSNEEKFAVVLEAAVLSEAELSRRDKKACIEGIVLLGCLRMSHYNQESEKNHDDLAKNRKYVEKHAQRSKKEPLRDDKLSTKRSVESFARCSVCSSPRHRGARKFRASYSGLFACFCYIALEWCVFLCRE